MTQPVASEEAHYPSPARAWYAVVILLLLYNCSYMDRAVLTMLLPYIQHDFSLTNLQISLLIGPAFGIVYTVLGVGAGWLTDRMDRRLLVTAGAITWGVATAASGFAGNAIQLALARLSIGVGEATLTPVAHSLIVEKFPPRRLSMALAVFSLGVTFGSGLALALGGILIDVAAGIVAGAPETFAGVRPWQLVFVMVAAPTLVLAPVIYTIGDPRGRRVASPSNDAVAAKPSDVVRPRMALVAPYFMGYGFVSIINTAMSSWIPTYMVKTFGLTMGDVGIGYGITFVLATGFGQMIWSGVVDRLYARGVVDIHARFQMASLIVSAPAVLLAFQVQSALPFLVLIGVFLFATYAAQGYANAGLQLVTPSAYRGRMAAMFLAFQVLIGSTFGPTSVGFLTDYVFHDADATGRAICVVVAVCAPLAMLMLWIAARKRRAHHAAEMPHTAPVETVETAR